MKRMMALLLSALMLLPLCGCGGGRQVTLYVGAPEESAWSAAAEAFKAAVEENTRVKVTIAYGASASEGMTAEGGLGLYALSDWQTVEERLAVVQMPWLFGSTGEAERVLLAPGPARTAVYELFRARGVEPMAIGENGFWQLTGDVHPMSTPAALEDLTFRITTNSFAYEILNAMGAECLPLSAADTLDALASGKADGQLSSLDTIYSENYYKVQRYLTLWDCSYDPLVLTADGYWWGALDEDVKAKLLDAAESALAQETAEVRARQESRIQEIAASGVEITTPDEESLAAFRAAAEPVYRNWRERIGDDLFALFGRTFE